MHDLHRGKWEIMAVNYYFQKSMWIFFLVINGMKIFETNGRSQFQNISNSLINILLKVSAYCKSAQILQKKQIRFNNNTYKFSKFSNKCSNNFKTIFDLLLCLLWKISCEFCKKELHASSLLLHIGKNLNFKAHYGKHPWSREHLGFDLDARD